MRDEKDTAVPHFYMKAVQNMTKSRQENRPVFDDTEMIEIKIPGDRNMTWQGVVTDEHRQRFAKQYEAFKKGAEMATTGTPLEMWPNPLLTPGRIAELKALNIFSLEDLANVTDSAGPNLGFGWRDLRTQARTYLEVAKDSSALAKLAQENEDLKRRLEALEMAQVKRGPGRPKKQESEAA